MTSAEKKEMKEIRNSYDNCQRKIVLTVLGLVLILGVFVGSFVYVTNYIGPQIGTGSRAMSNAIVEKMEKLKEERGE